MYSERVQHHGLHYRAYIDLHLSGNGSIHHIHQTNTATERSRDGQMIYPLDAQLFEKSVNVPHDPLLSSGSESSFWLRVEYVRPEYEPIIRKEIEACGKFRELTRRWVELALELAKLKQKKAGETSS